jgi:hypothetical protein
VPAYVLDADPIQLRPWSPLPFDGFTLAFAAGAQIFEADPAPFSNTKEIIILNNSSDDPIYAKIRSVHPSFPTTLNTATSTLIPPGTSLTLAIGPEGYRSPLATSTYWASNGAWAYAVTPPPNPTLGASCLNLVLYAPTVTVDFSVNITYVQCPGGGGGITP